MRLYGSEMRQFMEHRMEILRMVAKQITLNLGTNGKTAKRFLSMLINRHIGYNEYLFETASEKCGSTKVRVLLSLDQQLEFHFHQQWRTIWATFAMMQKNPQQSRALQKQWQEWSTNSETFKFFSPPPEIRNIIYVLSLDAEIEPSPKAQERKIHRPLGNPGTSIMHPNKQSWTEASSYFFSTNAFLLIHASLTERLISNEILSQKNTQPLLGFIPRAYVQALQSDIRR